GELPGEALLQARRGGAWVVALGARPRRRREARERGQRRRVVGRGGERELERVPRPGGVVERALAHLGLAHPERGGLAGRGRGPRPLAEEARRLVGRAAAEEQLGQLLGERVVVGGDGARLAQAGDRLLLSPQRAAEELGATPHEPRPCARIAGERGALAQDLGEVGVPAG